MVRRVLALLLLLAVAGGCNRGGGSSADTTIPPETSVVTTPPTSAPADVATIPPVIDEEYLNRVLAALDEVDGRATRLIVEKKDLVPEAAQLLAAIYDDEEFSQQTDIWLRTIQQDPSFSTFRPNPGNRITKVARVISRSPNCIWIAVSRDYSQITDKATGPEKDLEFVALVAGRTRSKSANLNPTAWIIRWDGLYSDGSEPADQCART